jgi:GAF domain-containing protein
MANIDPDLLAASLRRLDTDAGSDVAHALEETVHACVALFGVTGSGVMIADEHNSLHYVAASDGPGRVLEIVQTEVGQGPCVEAFVTNAVTASHDAAVDPRWPKVNGILAEQGIRAVLGLPVRIGGVPIGTLDVYRDQPYEWDDSEQAGLSRYSDVIETTLTAAMAAHRAGALADQLQYALDYRVTIERAIGYLMASRQLDATAAFDLLRRTARSNRRKVADLAEHLLTRGTLPPEQRR